MNIIPENKRREIAELFQRGFSKRRVAAAVSVTPVTALNWRRRIFGVASILCPCGRDSRHQDWCEYRISLSPERQTYLANCRAQSQATQAIVAARVRERKEDSAWWWLIKQLTPRPIRERIARKPRQRLAPLSTCYPYIREGEEADLMLAVDKAVPKTVLDDVRADACQELLLAILTGELTRENFTDHVGEYIRESYKQLGDRFKEVSLDAPLYKDGQTYSLLDTLAAPQQSEDEVYSVKHVYVRGGTPYAGALADCASASDLAERLSGSWEANRLLKADKPNYGIHTANRATDNRSVQLQVAGAGHMKMSSYVRHSGWEKIQPFKRNTRIADELMFSIREYQERRAEEESEAA